MSCVYLRYRALIRHPAVTSLQPEYEREMGKERKGWGVGGLYAVVVEDV